MPEVRRGGAALLLALLALTACGGGGETVPETSQERPDTLGVDARVGDVRLDDLYLQADATVPAGSDLPLRGAITNDASAADTLLEVSAVGTRSVTLQAPDGTTVPRLELPAGGQVASTTGPARVEVRGLESSVRLADQVALTFRFARAGATTVLVPVGPSS